MKKKEVIKCPPPVEIDQFCVAFRPASKQVIADALLAKQSVIEFVAVNDALYQRNCLKREDIDLLS